MQGLSSADFRVLEFVGNIWKEAAKENQPYNHRGSSLFTIQALKNWYKSGLSIPCKGHYQTVESWHSYANRLVVRLDCAVTNLATRWERVALQTTA